MTNHDKLIELAKFLVDQRDEPWPGGSESDRLHYWRDKCINAASIVRALATREQQDG